VSQIYLDLYVKPGQTMSSQTIEKKVGNIKLKIAMANTLILRFDMEQESRTLTHAEA
jgi:hypothetical protein